MTDGPAILTVCTGNLCRSPALERVLRFGFARLWPEALGELSIGSAGTHAMVGHSIPAPMMNRLAGAGADASPFAARQLTPELVAGADLVIALTRAHRAAAVELYPRAIRTTFTLRELARLSAELPPGDIAPLTPRARLATFVGALAGIRGRVLVEPDADDVVDPYRRSDTVYHEAFTQIVEGASTFVRAFVPQLVPV